jgi:hypothetical protein
VQIDILFTPIIELNTLIELLKIFQKSDEFNIHAQIQLLAIHDFPPKNIYNIKKLNSFFLEPNWWKGL